MKKTKKTMIKNSHHKDGNYLAKNDGHKECPKKVVCHLKDLSEHGVRKWQLSDHQQGLLRIEEAAEVTAAAAEMEHTIDFTFGHFLWIF